VVGWATAPDGRTQRGFALDLRDGGGAARHLGADRESRLHAVNNRGQAVGTFRADVSLHHALLWDLDTGTVEDLNSRLAPEHRWSAEGGGSHRAPSGWRLHAAWGINDQGQIVGGGSHMVEGTSHRRAYLLTPRAGAAAAVPR
jgi:uncharacterized membrane protein